MDRDNIIVLEYQKNFADNFTTFSYGKIFENKFKINCFYENSLEKRNDFESNMSDFNLDCSYISHARILDASSKSYFLTRKMLNNKKISTKNAFLNINRFAIDDLDLLTDEIKSMFKFNNLDFILNYDILEKITSSQSIGLYLNEKDYNEINWDFIQNAIIRLNKYIKKPKLFVFGKNKLKITPIIDYEIVKPIDWREEFYFLLNCRHKILPDLKYSYSTAFWSSVLNHKDYDFIAYDKALRPKKKYKNWLAV